MVKRKLGFVLEYVQNIQDAKRFYTDVLGLTAQREHPKFVQFPNFATASDEPLSRTGDLELYSLVDNAEDAFQELNKRVEVTLPLKQMPLVLNSIQRPSSRCIYYRGGQHSGEVGSDQDCCICGVLNSCRNLQEVRLRDLRNRLVLCDVELVDYHVHRVLNRPAVD